MHVYVEAYDEAEREALKYLPNRAIAACSLPVFTRIGYPTRVNSMYELWRYADEMQENRAKIAMDRLRGLTETEFDRLKSAIIAGSKASKECGQQLLPINAPLMSLIAFRIIACAAPPNATIFEVGPGSGYLGHMLLNTGYSYNATDVCQAFVLWQEHLLQKSVMKWWDWIDHRREDFSVDVITSNHALNEMHIFALQYLIVRAEKMLGKKGVFVIEDYGHQGMRNTEETTKLFANRGWREHAGGYLQLPPASEYDCDAFDKRALAFGPKTKTWDDVVQLWGSIECDPSPDEQFIKYIERCEYE